jgi:hypothetical protein
MRAILKLIAVCWVIAVFGIADSIEAPPEALYAAGGVLLLLLPFVIQRIDRRAIATPPSPRGEPAFARESITLDVIPLPQPNAIEDDLEGKTVRAPMSHEEAYEMHARYAPYFDQQAALARYQAEHGEADVEATVAPEQAPASQPMFDQHRYAQALQYADAFEEQLTARRRTAAYEVAPPHRVARGSYTPRQYRAAHGVRSDQRPSNSSDWESKTLIGVRPVKPAK